jgi:fimbrial isopeptide formation D2 family protein/uncharacterized repeat protein (TIGR01451 family)
MSRSRGFAGRGLTGRFFALLGSILIVSGTVLGAVTPVALGSTSGDTGFLAPSASPSPEEWDSEDDAFADDGVVATAGPGDDDDQGFDDFGFSFPAGSIIDGFEVQVEASSTDTDCQITVALSDDNGSNFGTNEPAQNLTADPSVLTFGGPTDTMGDDGSDGSDWDPATLEGGSSDFRLRVRFNDPGSSCDNAATAAVDYVAVKVYYRTFDDYAVSNPGLASDICEAADFNFVIDMSGSIGAQGSRPSNLPDLVSGINDFVDTFEMAGGDGRYSGTRFNDPDPKGSGTLSSPLTAGFVAAGTFQTAVNGLSSPSGWTPTAAGINAALANDSGDRAGVPNIGLILTDGSPNVPPSDSANLPSTWLTAADAAIAAADGMRADGYHVKAIYLSAPGDPGDTTLPFSDAGDAEWADAVMTQLGAGSWLDANFSTFADEILDLLGCRPEVLISKVADDGTIDAGDEIGFTVTLQNLGDPAEGLVVTDHLAAGIDWSEDPNSPDWDLVAHSGHEDLVWIGGTLGKGSSSVHVVGLTDAADCGTVDNTASFTTTNDGEGTASDSVTVRCPDVSVVKSPDGEEVNATDQVQFSILVTNAGPGEAKDVTLEDELPTGYSWTIGGADGADCQNNGGTLECDFGDLGDDATRTVTLTAPTTVDDCERIDNVASVAASNEPANKTGDNTDDADVTVNCPDVEVAKASEFTAVSAGGQVDFTVTIRNIGSGVAYDATASDTLEGDGWFIWPPVPDGWVLAGGVLSYGPDDLDPGESHTVRVVRETTAEDCGLLENEVTAFAANEREDVLANNTASDSVLIVCPDVSVTKEADEGPFSAGQQIGFTITISNGPSALARDVTAIDHVPGVGWAIDGPANGWSIDADGDLVFGPEDLQPNESRSVHVVRETTFDDCGLLDNTVTVSASNEPQDALGNNSASDELTVECPDLGITKTADHQGPVLAGSEIGFTVEIVNNGDGDAFDVSVSDTLPAGYGWSIESQTGGWSLVGGELTFGPATLAAHSSSSVHVVADTDTEDCGEVPNTAVLGQSVGVDVLGVRLALPFGQGEIGSDDATEVLRCPALGIEKETESSTVVVGQTVDFTIDVTVVDGPVTNAVVTDVLPAGQTYVDGSQTSSVPATFEQAGQVLTWTFASLDTGDPAVTITYQVTIGEGTGGQILVNPVEICVEEIEICESDEEAVDVEARFDVSIEKSNDAPLVGDLPTAVEGDTITYTLAYDVFVEGLDTAAVIFDVLPEGVTYVNGSASSDALFTFDSFIADALADNGVSGYLIWVADPAASGDGSLTYQATADDGAAELAQPLVNVGTICLGFEDGDEEEPILCDDAESEVFVNEPPLGVTPPPTDTIADRAPAAGGPNLPLILVFLGVLTFLVGLLTPVPAAARARRDR